MTTLQEFKRLAGKLFIDGSFRQSKATAMFDIV